MARKRVVVVDDDALLTKTIQLCLTRKGHEVRTFHEGVDAIKCLFECRPDAIIMDLRLPDCDGWFLARAVEKFHAQDRIPLILISVLDPDRRKLSQARPYAYIQKPFDMGELMNVVDRSLFEPVPVDCQAS